VKRGDRCLAGSEHVSAPLKRAIYLSASAQFPGWHIVLYDGEPTAMWAHTVAPPSQPAANVSVASQPMKGHE
jgi:hypothetical protein